MIGETLGPYKILEQIGSGGMATVYKARQAAMDRFVAIKVLPANMAQDPNFTARFTQEARTIAKLEHPFILPVYDAGQDRGIHYIVMRYMEAGTLGDLLNRGQPDLRYSVRLIQRIAEALDYAHSQGVVHRDIKPNNILIDKNGQPYLTDFGIAKIIEGSQNLTGSAIIGTPAYMSPEQGQGLPVDNRSDIYSLGVMLYEMVTGRRPFEADTPMAVVIKHMQEPLPPPSTLVPNLPHRLEAAMTKALEKDREDRYHTAGEFARALEESLADIKGITGAVRPAATARQPAGTGQARPYVTAGQSPTLGERPDETGAQKQKRSGPNWLVWLGCGGLGLVGLIALIVLGVFFLPDLLPTSEAVAPAGQTATFQAAYQMALRTANAASSLTAPAPAATQPAATSTPASASAETQAAATSAPPTAASAPAGTAAPTACSDDGVFISDVTIPDNSPVAANTAFTKTWEVKNTGGCTWDSSYSLKFVGGDQMGGPAAAAFPGSVLPDGHVDLSVSLVAPPSPGTYTGQWRLANREGVLFGTGGHSLTVIIVVPATPTATLVPTNTTVPTDTPSPETPTPTATRRLIIIIPTFLRLITSTPTP